MKICPKTSSESNTLSGILFGAILGSFWIDFGPIFDPKLPIWRPKSSKMASRRPLEHSFDFHWFLSSILDRPGGRGRRRLAWSGVSCRPSRPRGETTDFEENPAGSRVPALVARMGLGSVSIGSFASYGKYKLACIFADLLRSVGGSMITNAAGTAWNAARRILRAAPSALP